MITLIMQLRVILAFFKQNVSIVVHGILLKSSIQKDYRADVRIDFADGSRAHPGRYCARVVEVGAVFGAHAATTQCD